MTKRFLSLQSTSPTCREIHVYLFAMMLGHVLLAVIEVSSYLWRLIRPLPDRRPYRCLTFYLQAAEWEDERITKSNASSKARPPHGEFFCDD